MGACRDTVRSRHEPSAGRCMRCRGSEHVLPLLRLVRELVYSAQAIIAEILSIQVCVPGDTHSLCVSNVIILSLLDLIEQDDFKSQANFGQWSRCQSSTHAEYEVARCVSRPGRHSIEQARADSMARHVVANCRNGSKYEWRLLKHSLSSP